MPHVRAHGFTLAELLIALAILGVIATFTIPKILTAQQDQKNNAVVKEVAAAIAAAYQAHKLSGADVSIMKAHAITSYLNYVSLDSSSFVDSLPGTLSYTCGTGGRPCFRLHSGAVLRYYGDNFCNGTPTGIPYEVDPDGVYSGTTNGPGKAVRFFLYSDGRITTEGTLATATVWSADGSSTCGFSRSAIAASDPAWFTW